VPRGPGRFSCRSDRRAVLAVLPSCQCPREVVCGNAGPSPIAGSRTGVPPIIHLAHSARVAKARAMW
jgi:hypothetical protein